MQINQLVAGQRVQVKQLTIHTKSKSNILQLAQNANNTSYNWYRMQIKHLTLVQNANQTSCNSNRMHIIHLIIGTECRSNIIKLVQNANNTSFTWYRMQIKFLTVGAWCK